jgi:hypothetical protein
VAPGNIGRFEAHALGAFSGAQEFALGVWLHGLASASTRERLIPTTAQLVKDGEGR